MIQYQLYPRYRGMSRELLDIVEAFRMEETNIDSTVIQGLTSNAVLAKVGTHLKDLGITVEESKKADDKIEVPVLFGGNNKIDKCFYADGLSADGKIVIEVEAGRALDNNQFLKDIFEASMMVDVEYLVLAVRNLYRGSENYAKINTFIETLYLSNRITLPLKGILLIGY